MALYMIVPILSVHNVEQAALLVLHKLNAKLVFRGITYHRIQVHAQYNMRAVLERRIISLEHLAIVEAAQTTAIFAMINNVSNAYQLTLRTIPSAKNAKLIAKLVKV